MAVLRQLAGARRGIEIANAHYGYFPIEGRIPLASPLSLSLPLSVLLCLVSSSFRPSPFRARTHTHVYIPPPVLWLSLRTFSLLAYALLRSFRFSFSSSHVLPFSVSFSLPLCPFHLALVSPLAATNTRRDVRTHVP